MTSTDNSTKAPKAGDKVSNPLHLLQTLTRTLNEHLASACNQAEQDAQKVMDKLQRQQEKLELKLSQTQQKLAARETEQPDKPANKTRKKLGELEAAKLELHEARQKAESYIKQLNSDVRQTLRLAKGLERIDSQVGQALEKRDTPAPAAKPRARRPATPRHNTKPTRARKPKTTTPPAN
ncbi:hypothetical protein LCGC14_0046910 [marine sediment metagenome]|uniref:Uncharacterized protein n=1 Tax=marine sediment metagenome TaxID=412755 RepID=A0A0F9YT77_9ZZZZ|nr:hypothetical protein [Halopseudomonas sabulinigri]